MRLTREQFEALALAQIDTITRLARARARTSVEAEDLVQETYLRAIRSWQSFELREHGIRPWLAHILTNVQINRSIREARQPKSTRDEALDQVPEVDSPAQAEWEANEDLRAAMRRLPAESRLILTLWAVEQFSYKEMAQTLDIPIGTVMSRLFRARQQLKDEWNAICKKSSTTK
jgi:RNA polymerase sigma-70 factor, ECF subfamily